MDTLAPNHCHAARPTDSVARIAHTASPFLDASRPTEIVPPRRKAQTASRVHPRALAALETDGVVAPMTIAPHQQEAVSQRMGLVRLPHLHRRDRSHQARAQTVNVGQDLERAIPTNAARWLDSAELELFNYGPACDANKVPSGTNTSSISRTKLGSVLYGSDGIYDCVQPGTMALTFDDGPFIYTSHILDLLKQYNASATFFITGNNNGKGEIDNTSLPWPALIKRMYAEGHQVASHTWSHPDLCNITSAQRKNEMYKNEMALRNILGVIPTYMRPPYSSCTAQCGCDADLADLGYHVTYFDLDTQDYLNDSPTLIQNSKNIFDAALAGKSSTTDDFLVIGHDIHNQTSQVLVEYMLQGIRSRGYTPVTVGTCLGDPKENWYRTDTSSTLGS
ncbi:hypothetical protein BP5796_00353 [Coleophoma crateriformis]|uniref:NodB homology domain-containing protein n=1 Tax=Coleophoma crateriformis TaxID=565419 RepID=A0A3D8T7T7_9HELO|nr:hypothetical protein BP5796_00353 [Coleophoma crateriformis]